MVVLIMDLEVLETIPSTLAASEPSNERIPTKRTKEISTKNNTLFLMKSPNFDISMISVMLLTKLNTVASVMSGTRKKRHKLLIHEIIKTIVG